MKIKTNAYLFRVNGWIIYGVLLLSAFVNWDALIAKFNIRKAKQVQAYYLLSLSYTVLPDLYTYHDDQKKESIWNVDLFDFERQRDGELYSFLNDREKLNWKSWYYDSKKTYEELLNKDTVRKIERLNLFSMEIASMGVFKSFHSIYALNLENNHIGRIEEVTGFKALRELNLQHNNLRMLKGIESLKSLEVLDIRKNQVMDYSPLFELKKLKKLYVNDDISDSDLVTLQRSLPDTMITK